MLTTCCKVWFSLQKVHLAEVAIPHFTAFVPLARQFERYLMVKLYRFLGRESNTLHHDELYLVQLCSQMDLITKL